jgi:hypothetical protein
LRCFEVFSKLFFPREKFLYLAREAERERERVREKQRESKRVQQKRRRANVVPVPEEEQF